jgi:hypothetical protein
MAAEGRSTESKTKKIEAKSPKQKEQEVKDQEIKNVYLKLFQAGYITKEDLEKSKLPIKVPAQEIIIKQEIIINKPVNTEDPNQTNVKQPLDIHQRNQKKFLKWMRSTDKAIKKSLDMEAGKKRGSSFYNDPFDPPYVEPLDAR